MSPQNSNRNNFWVCMSNTEMLEMKGNKKRLPISLSFLTLTDSKKQTSAHKSPRNFEEPNGVVGLGILAAMNDDRHHHQDPICNNGSRTAVLAISPKSASNPIPILRNKNASENKTNEKLMSVEKMEFCEEYTCVISHVGKNLVEKREYFEADILGNRGCPAAILVSPVSSGGGETAAFRTADFLSSCFLCQKMLQGLDVFMYRGDKAFCSAECRYRQICIDEQKEKRRSGARKSMAMVKFSVSPCSVAAA